MNEIYGDEKYICCNPAVPPRTEWQIVVKVEGPFHCTLNTHTDTQTKQFNLKPGERGSGFQETVCPL